MTITAPRLGATSLLYESSKPRNIVNRGLTAVAAMFSLIAVLPLILVLIYVLIKGGASIHPRIFFELPPPPGLSEPKGMGNAIIGTIAVTAIGALVSIPVGIGGGIYLAEMGRTTKFADAVRFGVNVLSGVPSIICGLFVYALVVNTRVIFGESFTAVAGGISLAVLMLPTIIKTTDEGMKLVPHELRLAAYGVGASRFVTITRVVLPAAIAPIATGVVLAIARAAGETAPLIFTCLFSPFWPDWERGLGLLAPVATMSVQIYNFGVMPFETQRELAWAASFVLVVLILGANLLARWLARFTAR
ncbi:MAG: phosphate ABC transporter permease PstA [Aphanocapsa feldmannii 277cV]|uniref:Phosphate transport system permease protein PstA n=2 Tax=Aphanocapsa feldmannii TaxID=192050 RepID=A0A524RLA9_9CHRO|nr:MAG: phosphate ABC transporter permease PstA [Aphanocapsa feldmannii 288cV]TGG90847.1 MAG: phosphate ABC transporter permease PstA [Aphanocapsa feldmannii 277cV]TGH22673.1 MAG: phosphate ABC transporter permease PstA [Aphanocapsa feldmannii 277cI]